VFNSSILDVIIGLVFCFASVALFVSSINEAIASLLKLRHKTLLSGMQQLLNDPQGNGLVKALYAHALVNPMSLDVPFAAAIVDSATTPLPAPAPIPGQATKAQVVVRPQTPAWALGKQLPSYIASKDFANALIDVIQAASDDKSSLKADIDQVADPQLRQMLQGFWARAQGDVDKLSDSIADWFDNAMGRLSGSYKRRSQFWTFAIGLVVAASLNIDAFQVLDQLWRRPELSAAISSPASKDLIAAAVVQDRRGQDSSEPSATDKISHPSDGPALLPERLMSTLSTLPVGWEGFVSPSFDLKGVALWLKWVLGVAVTASAAVFGAPFWFDLLQQVIQIRGAGTKPATNIEQKRPQANSRAGW
jgi:hypothetical protein